MGAADRKVVHDTVNDIDGVRTSSEGEEPRRRVRDRSPTTDAGPGDRARSRCSPRPERLGLARARARRRPPPPRRGLRRAARRARRCRWPRPGQRRRPARPLLRPGAGRRRRGSLLDGQLRRADFLRRRRRRPGARRPGRGRPRPGRGAGPDQPRSAGPPTSWPPAPSAPGRHRRVRRALPAPGRRSLLVSEPPEPRRPLAGRPARRARAGRRRDRPGAGAGALPRGWRATWPVGPPPSRGMQRRRL